MTQQLNASSPSSNPKTSELFTEMNFQVQETLMTLNQDALDKCIGRETLVVTGAPRGMTSLVAFSLYECGYFLGESLGAKNFEDQDFVKAIKPLELSKKPLRDNKLLLDLIAKRNLEYQRWGFKLPHAGSRINELKTLLRNPVFVICIRNPLSTAKSILKYEPKRTFTASQLLDIGTRYYTILFKIAETNESPAILVNMESASRSPDSFLVELSSILSLPRPDNKLSCKLAIPGYKTATPRSGVTFIPQ